MLEPFVTLGSKSWWLCIDKDIYYTLTVIEIHSLALVMLKWIISKRVDEINLICLLNLCDEGSSSVICVSCLFSANISIIWVKRLMERSQFSPHCSFCCEVFLQIEIQLPFNSSIFFFNLKYGGGIIVIKPWACKIENIRICFIYLYIWEIILVIPKSIF